MAHFQNPNITNKDSLEVRLHKLRQQLEPDVIAPVIAPILAPVIAPILAPVIAPILAPVIAPVLVPILAPVFVNTSAQVAGAGTDYALTVAYAAVVFGTTSPAILLPSAGTYLILANAAFKDALVLNNLHAKIRDITNGVDVGAEKIVTVAGASGARRTNLVLNELLTVSGPVAVQLFAYNETSVSGSVESITSNIRYIKLAA